MSRVVALSGLGEDAAIPAPASAPRTMLLWGLVIGATVGIFVGTLMIKPGARGSSRRAR